MNKILSNILLATFLLTQVVAPTFANENPVKEGAADYTMPSTPASDVGAKDRSSAIAEQKNAAADLAVQPQKDPRLDKLKADVTKVIAGLPPENVLDAFYNVYDSKKLKQMSDQFLSDINTIWSKANREGVTSDQFDKAVWPAIEKINNMLSDKIQNRIQDEKLRVFNQIKTDLAQLIAKIPSNELGGYGSSKIRAEVLYPFESGVLSIEDQAKKAGEEFEERFQKELLPEIQKTRDAINSMIVEKVRFEAESAAQEAISRQQTEERKRQEAQAQAVAQTEKERQEAEAKRAAEAAKATAPVEPLPTAPSDQSWTIAFLKSMQVKLLDNGKYALVYEGKESVADGDGFVNAPRTATVDGQRITGKFRFIFDGVNPSKIELILSNNSKQDILLARRGNEFVVTEIASFEDGKLTEKYEISYSENSIQKSIYKYFGVIYQTPAVVVKSFYVKTVSLQSAVWYGNEYAGFTADAPGDYFVRLVYNEYGNLAEFTHKPDPQTLMTVLIVGEKDFTDTDLANPKNQTTDGLRSILKDDLLYYPTPIVTANDGNQFRVFSLYGFYNLTPPLRWEVLSPEQRGGRAIISKENFDGSRKYYQVLSFGQGLVINVISTEQALTGFDRPVDVSAQVETGSTLRVSSDVQGNATVRLNNNTLQGKARLVPGQNNVWQITGALLNVETQLQEQWTIRVEKLATTPSYVIRSWDVNNGAKRFEFNDQGLLTRSISSQSEVLFTYIQVNGAALVSSRIEKGLVDRKTFYDYDALGNRTKEVYLSKHDSEGSGPGYSKTIKNGSEITNSVVWTTQVPLLWDRVNSAADSAVIENSGVTFPAQVAATIVKGNGSGTTQGAGFELINKSNEIIGFELFSDRVTYTAADGKVTLLSLPQGIGFGTSSGNLQHQDTVAIPTYVNNNLAPGTYSGTAELHFVLSSGANTSAASYIHFEIEVKNG